MVQNNNVHFILHDRHVGFVHNMGNLFHRTEINYVVRTIIKCVYKNAIAKIQLAFVLYRISLRPSILIIIIIIIIIIHNYFTCHEVRRYRDMEILRYNYFT